MAAPKSSPPRGRFGIEWLVSPWVGEMGLRARAHRIAVVSGVLTGALLPSMLLFFGPDDWWWDTTIAVCLLIPVFMIGFDELADRIGRWRGRPVLGMPRMAGLLLGLATGHIAGYGATLLVGVDPSRTVHMMAADFRRNMGVILPVALLCWLAGASSYHRLQSLRMESAAARAGFDALKGQMQPHFLFNSLNALKELIADDPERARDFAQRLADLYRLILRVSASPTAPLSDELAIVEHYLEVERVRFGERLRYRFDVPEELRSLHVPTLMLQTLAENAVKHGIAKSRGGGEIVVRAQRSGPARLELEVANTGAPFDSTGADAPGRMGLANTRARLAMMYGEGALLSVTSAPAAGTKVGFSVTGEALA